MTEDRGALATPTETPQGQAPSTDQNNWYGIVALVAGLIGAGVVAVVFGHLGLRAAHDLRATNRKLSLAGTILGWVEVGAVGAALLSFGLAAQNRAEDAQDVAAAHDAAALYAAMQPVWTATVDKGLTFGSGGRIWIDQQRVFGTSVKNDVWQFGKDAPVDVMTATAASPSYWHLAYDTGNPYVLTCIEVGYGDGKKSHVYYDSTLGVTYDKTAGCTR